MWRDTVPPTVALFGLQVSDKTHVQFRIKRTLSQQKISPMPSTVPNRPNVQATLKESLCLILTQPDSRLSTDLNRRYAPLTTIRSKSPVELVAPASDVYRDNTTMQSFQ